MATKQKSQSQAQSKSQEEETSRLGEPTFRSIDDLQTLGINVSDIKKLAEAGIATVGTVLQTSMKELTAIKGLSDAKVEKIKEAAKKLDCRGPQFKTALMVREMRKQVIRITTGSSAVDAILGGGIETASITELFGEFRTGKTQMAHTLCVSTQLAFSSGGGQGKVIYVDTEGNFRPERIVTISERYGLDTEETMDNIIVCRVFTHEEQMEVLKPIAALISDPNQGPFRLLIVDSIIALFRVEFSGRGELADRQQKLGIHMSHLVRIAEEFNIAVVIINQCMSDPSGGMQSMFGPTIKPVGGHVLAHASTTRVMLKKGKGEQRIAKIFDSPLMPEEDATFQISGGGIADV